MLSVAITGSEAVAHRPSARFLTVLSGIFILLQVVATDYGMGTANGQAAAFWFVVGAVLLGLVYRKRSRVARGLVVIVALFGALLYGTAAVDDGRAALLAVAYLGQAVPLLTPSIRRHLAGGGQPT